MALVVIVYAPTADRLGPDLTRMGKIEEMDDDLARMMAGDGTGQHPGDGSARWPTAEELAAYQEQQQATQGDLSKMTKAALLEHAAALGVDVDDTATKADIVNAIETHQADVVKAQADTMAMSRTDIGTSGDPVAVIAAVNEQNAALADASAE